MGDSYSEYRPGQSEVFLATQTVISAKDQLREHRYSFSRHIHRSIEIYLISSGCCSMILNWQMRSFRWITVSRIAYIGTNH